MIGERIVNNIDTLKTHGATDDHEIKGNDNLYLIKGNGYRAKLKINPDNWLGIEFYLVDKNGKDLLMHTIDTDLYPISQSKYQDFAKDIEDEIADFLVSLREDKIRVGEKKGKIAMIIPKGNQFLLLMEGKLITS